MRAHSIKDFNFLIDKTGDCWLWTGAVNNKGYGMFRMRRYFKTRLAHRIMYSIKYGEPPEHLDICHTCDTTRCVNPDHLFLGTHKDNMGDAARKGRLGAYTFDKYTLDIMREAWNSGTGQKALTRQFGIDASVFKRLFGPRPHPQVVSFTDEQASVIIKLHRNRVPLTRIGERFGTSANPIKKLLMERDAFVQRQGNPNNW
jgi:hypothetical protein